MSLLEPGRPTSTLPPVIRVNGAAFHVVPQQVSIKAGIDACWAELAGNFAGVATCQPAITKSYVVPGEPAEGLGAARHCDIDFAGRAVSIDERIIDWIDTPEHKEFTYDVYQSEGFPAKVYNTWRMRPLGEHETELTGLFIMRMRPPFMGRFMLGRLDKATKSTVLGFKHYLETGTPATSAGELVSLYPGR